MEERLCNIEKEYSFFPIEEGDIIVNLGACVGWATLFFSKKVGKSGLVIAVEPMIENYKVLINVIIKNKLTNVIPLLTAVGKDTSRRRINFNTGIGGHSLIFIGLGVGRIVPVLSWNDLVTLLNLTHIDLAKIDIEGSETELLEGMSKVLPNKMIMEEHCWLGTNWMGTDMKYIMKLLEDRNYKLLGRKKHLLYLERNKE